MGYRLDQWRTRQCPIMDKQDFARLANAGVIGNTPKNWDTLRDCMDDDEYWRRSEHISVCISGPSGGHFRKYHQSRADVSAILDLPFVVDSAGYACLQSQLYAYENPPKALQERWPAFQGEWCSLTRSLAWAITNQPLGRVKRAHGLTHVNGLAATAVLRHHLGDELEELEEVEARFPGSTVEFTRFNWPCGIFRRKLLIWEVRYF